MSTTSTPPFEGAVAPRRGGWMKWVIAGCMGALVMLFAAGALFWFFLSRATAGPEESARAFLAAAAAGDYKAAHEHFSDPLKQQQPLDEFTGMVRANSHLFDITHTRFTSRSIDTTGAELGGTVTLSGGSKLPVVFKFIKENGQWKLLGYNIGT